MIGLRYARNGDPAEVVAPAEMPVPEPGEGEVRLRMLRSPIHNHDLATIRGTYGVNPAMPAVGGTEMVGIVDKIDPGAGTKQGARVAAMVPGAWSEYVIASAGMLVPVPDGVPDDAASQLLAMPMSAVVLFDTLRVKSGDWIVQNAASGAVGRILDGLARAAGVNMINVVRRESAVEELKKYGAKHVVVTSGDDWPKRVRDAAGGEPIVRVVDSVCDGTSLQLNRLLGKFGEHVIFGALGGTPLKLDPGPIIFNESVVRGFWMSPWMTRASNEERVAAMMRVFTLLQKGDLPLPVGGVYPLNEAKSALIAAETPGRRGKVLFSPPSS